MPDDVSYQPSINELESLIVNNPKLSKIQSHLNHFNPIRVMKMERMEIRHSLILAWLLDPTETHGIGDQFLRAFLGEALSGFNVSEKPNALDIALSDMRDVEVRTEWKNIDIFIYAPKNGWAFVIENKFDSRQHEGQLAKYREKIESVYKASHEKLVVRGIFLTLQEEEPQDASFAPIRYEALLDLLEQLIALEANSISTEVMMFLRQYLDVLKDATGMSVELNEMEKLARELYRDHKKVLDFIVEHGSGSDFALAARSVFSEDANTLDHIDIDGSTYVFGSIGNNIVSFLPLSWYRAFGENKYHWEGCEKWGMQFPVYVRIRLIEKGEMRGQLRLNAEVGPVPNYEFRRGLIERIKEAASSKGLQNVSFQKGATEEGKRFSKFFSQNNKDITDIHDSDEIGTAMRNLLNTFDPVFEKLSASLEGFLEFGLPKK